MSDIKVDDVVSFFGDDMYLVIKVLSSKLVTIANINGATRNVLASDLTKVRSAGFEVDTQRLDYLEKELIRAEQVVQDTEAAIIYELKRVTALAFNDSYYNACLLLNTCLMRAKLLGRDEAEMDAAEIYHTGGGYFVLAMRNGEDLLYASNVDGVWVAERWLTAFDYCNCSLAAEMESKSLTDEFIQFILQNNPLVRK